MNKKFSNLQIIFFIFILAWAIILPFRSGYLTLLDFGAIPGTIVSINPIQSGIGNILLDSLRNLLGQWISQWILFLGIEFLVGYGIFRFLKISLPENNLKNSGIFFGIFLAMMSPFTYQRLVEGQYLVILGWAILFLAISYLYEYIRFDKKNSLLTYGILSALAVSFSSHSIFFVLLISSGIFLKNNFGAKNIEKKSNFGKNIVNYLGIIAIVIILNLNWILGAIFGKSDVSSTISQIDYRHLQAFETTSGGVGSFFNALSMHGFWGENLGRFALDTGANSHWQILFLMIFGVVIVGVYHSLKNKYNDKNFSIWLLCVSIVAYILGLGIKGGIFAPISEFLYNHIPFYIGLREPQKWIGMLVLCYSFFGARGASEIIEYFSKIFELKKYWIGGVILALPILYNPYMLFGLKGQLSTADYPASWQNAKNYLFQNYVSGTGYDVLVLPWHQYLKYDFMPKISANPASWYFSDMSGKHKNILAGDNMELQNVYTQSTRPASKIVEKYIGPVGLWEKNYTSIDGQNFVSDMKTLGIKNILLFQQIDGEKNLQYLQNLEKDGLIKKTFYQSGVYIFEF